MKILLATDGSEHSKLAAEELASRPFPTSTKLMIISVYKNPSLYMYAPLPMGGMDNYYQQAELTMKKVAH